MSKKIPHSGERAPRRSPSDRQRQGALALSQSRAEHQLQQARIAHLPADVEQTQEPNDPRVWRSPLTCRYNALPARAASGLPAAAGPHVPAPRARRSNGAVPRRFGR